MTSPEPEASTTPAPAPWDSRFAEWILLFCGLLVLVPGSETMPLLDRDEPRFSQATVEMMEGGEWIIPTFDGDYRFDKPVLTYWLMRGGYALFGLSELGARFHSIVCAILTAFVILWFGTRMFSRAHGFGGGLMWILCAQVWMQGRLAIADMPMVLFVATSHWALYELLLAPEARPRRRWILLLWISLALGFLAKGPIAWVVPLLTILLMRFWLWRKPLPLGHLRAHLGVPLMLAIVAAWGVPALVLTNGEFFNVGIGHHVVDRGVEAFNGRVPLPFYYLLTAPLSLFPWIALAPFRIGAIRREWDARRALLFAWFLGPYLVFTFYSTQLPHYVMPGFPGFFLLLAPLPILADGTRWKLVWARALLGVPLLAAIIALVAHLEWGAHDTPRALTAACFLPLILVAYGGIGAYASLQANARQGGFTSILLLVGFVACGSWLVAHNVREASLPVRLHAVAAELPEDAALVTLAYHEPSLVWYSNRRWRQLQSIEEMEALVASDRPFALYLRDRTLKLDDYVKLRWNGRLDPPEYPPLELPSAPDIEERFLQGLNLGNTSWGVGRLLIRHGAAKDDDRDE